MQTINLPEAIDKVLADDSRYERDAYLFLRDALEATLKQRRKTRREGRAQVPPQDVSPKEFLEGFRFHALKEFGPMAKFVLNYWNIRSCEDIGNMVFNLVKAQLFSKTDSDTLEAFQSGFDFNEAFVSPFRPARRLARLPARVPVKT